MSTVKVSNKTKGAKGALAQFRLVDVDLEVCGHIVPAGESVVVPVEDWELEKHSYTRLVKLGALVSEPFVEPSSAEAKVEEPVHTEAPAPHPWDWDKKNEK